MNKVLASIRGSEERIELAGQRCPSEVIVRLRDTIDARDGTAGDPIATCLISHHLHAQRASFRDSELVSRVSPLITASKSSRACRIEVQAVL